MLCNWSKWNAIQLCWLPLRDGFSPLLEPPILWSDREKLYRSQYWNLGHKNETSCERIFCRSAQIPHEIDQNFTQISPGCMFQVKIQKKRKTTQTIRRLRYFMLIATKFYIWFTRNVYFDRNYTHINILCTIINFTNIEVVWISF